MVYENVLMINANGNYWDTEYLAIFEICFLSLSEDSPMKKAQKTNWSLEFGGGIVGKRCLSPFAEYRYIVKWHETNLRLGILLDFDCGSGASGYHPGGQKAVNCPGH